MDIHALMRFLRLFADGNHTIKVNAKDNDGNAATERTVTFKVDATPPTLSVSAPTNNLVTNNASCVLTGKTSDVTAGVKSVTVSINGGTATDVTVDSSGNFSTTITLVEEQTQSLLLHG